jgi:hypothetical protein
MTAYNPLARDLTSFGGPADGWLYEGIAQELDVETNTVLFEWHSLDHVDPSLCFANPVDATEENPWDYFRSSLCLISHPLPLALLPPAPLRPLFAPSPPSSSAL